MQKLNLLKAVIYQLICENKLVVNAFKQMRQKEILPPFFDISYTNISSYSSGTGITLNISDIIDCYNLAHKYQHDNIEKFLFNSEYMTLSYCYERSNWISVNCWDTEECLVLSKLENTDFLTKDENIIMTDIETLAINAMAYILYHEIGHALYDQDMQNSNPVKKEKKADEFAFEAIKSMYNNNDDAGLMGAFIGISNILLRRTPASEIDDREHPHSIERLYNLLNFWKIEDDSYCWELAYNVVCNWCRKNEILISLWEKDSSKSYKDKFMDAYLHFQKKT